MRTHRSKSDSKKVMRQEKSARTNSTSSVSPPAQKEASTANFSSPLYRPGSLINNVSRTLQQNSMLSRKAPGTRIHAKMEISQPDDPDEQEADAMAQKVVQEIQRASQFSEVKIQGNSRLGREMDTQSVQRKSALQRQSDEGGGMEATPEIETLIEQESGKGQPLASGLLEQMEGAFGEDLSQVRIHTDSTAEQLNQAVEAKAFTVEKDIFFNQDTYDPDSIAGKELLAHELTHVLQQSRD
ncbi:MAG: DUF4157 domain-containing protein [Okeania sp. SIO2D1]|nr:DUF4157 domain-containing protein [Okeania sp. SIO2D1]